MTIFKTPDLESKVSKNNLFIGGTIDDGQSIDWQSDVMDDFVDFDDSELTVYSPRCSDWISNLDQRNLKPGHPLYDQIKWEEEALERCNLILFHFVENSKSPITLLELGEYGPRKDKKVVVSCPLEFYQYGNVGMFCKRHDIEFFRNLRNAVTCMRDMIRAT